MKLFRIFAVLIVSQCSLNSANASTIMIDSGTSNLSNPELFAVRMGMVLPSISLNTGVLITSTPILYTETLISSPLLGGDTGISISQGTTGDYNIYTDGDMFLDYSVFSENQDLFVGSNKISITARQSLIIFAFNNAPTLPDLSNTAVFTSLSNNMNELGNILLFSETPTLNGEFEATGNVYIGNYSSLQPVPLPASAILLLSGLAMFVGGAAANRRLKGRRKTTCHILNKALC